MSKLSQDMDKFDKEMVWFVRFLFFVITLGLLFSIFLISKASAAPLPDPTVVPDPSYPSGTPITYTCDSSSNYLTLFREDSGLSTQGAVVCSSGGTPHPVGYWFGPGTEGPADGDGNYILVETSAYSTGDCRGNEGETDIDTCRAGATYVSEFSPFCMGACEGGGGGGGGTTTATTTFSTSTQMIDNPSQNIFNGMLLFFIGLFLAIWLQRKH